MACQIHRLQWRANDWPAFSTATLAATSRTISFKVSSFFCSVMLLVVVMVLCPDLASADAPEARLQSDTFSSDTSSLVQSAPSEAVENDLSMIALLDGEILFGLGKYELTSEGRLSLQRLIGKLKQFERIISIRFIGHTDDIGSNERNQVLSESRARWISQQFSLDYPDTHVLIVGAGESAPVFSNKTEAGRQRNRRVEVQVIATGKPLQ